VLTVQSSLTYRGYGERRGIMQELLKQMQESRETAYRSYRWAELTEDEGGVAFASGVVAGIDRMINLVKEFEENV
jgi:hypothetical protein